MEDAQGVALAEQLKGLGIVHGDGGDVQPGIHVNGDELQGAIDDRQSLEPQEVEFNQPGHLGVLHVVLGEDLVLGAPADWQIFHHKFWRDHHAGRVGGGVARQPLKGLGNGEQFRHPRVSFPGLAQSGLLLHRLFDGDLQFLGDELGNPVHLAVGHGQGTAHVADDGPGLQGAEGDDLGHVVGAVPLLHVLEHLAPSFLAKIHVKVGHGLALDVQEALEDEAVGNGVDVGDTQAVRHQAAGPGTAARPHRDALALGPVDEVGDNQKVAGKAHGHDDADLHFQPVLVVFFLLFREVWPGTQGRQAPGKTVTRLCLEQGRAGLAGGQRKNRKMVLAKG